MIRSTLLLCAEKITSGASAHALTIHTPIEQLTVAWFPALLPAMDLLCLVKREPNDPDTLHCRLVMDIGDEQVADHGFAIDFQGNRGVRTIIHLEHFAIPKPGSLRIAVVLGTKVLNVWEIQIDGVAVA